VIYTLADINGTWRAVLDWPYTGHAVSTLILMVTVVMLRWLIIRSITGLGHVPSEQRRRVIVSVRNVLLIVLLLGLVMIWGSELRVAALSVFAIAAAIVIATKELIMCISGSFIRTGSHAFKVGDRIEVGGIRGDVFDTTLLTTTLFEIGPGPNAHQSTGRTVQIPNSVFLSQSVINETATDEFVLHSLVIPLKISEDLAAAEHALISAARAECGEYLETARRHMEEVGRSQGIEALSVEPRVSIHLPDPERVNLMLRFPVPARRKGRVEQAILRRYITTRPKPVEKPVPPQADDGKA